MKGLLLLSGWFLALCLAAILLLPPRSATAATEPCPTTTATTEVTATATAVPLTATAAPTESPSVNVGGLVWRIVKREDLGQHFDWKPNYPFTTTGKYVRLQFELDNVGKAPARPNRTEALLVDQKGRQFAEMDYQYQFQELCEYAKVNPGLTVPCVMVFDVAKDAEALSLHLSAGDDIGETPLPVQQGKPKVKATDARSKDHELGLGQVDALGIPYSLTVDSKNITITEWVVFTDTDGRFNLAGQISVTADPQPFQHVIAEVRFYDADNNLIGLDDIANVDFRLLADGYSRFSGPFNIEADQIDHYAIRLATVP